MRNKLCTDCPLSASANTVCLWGRAKTDKPEDVKLMVIGEMPSEEDDKNDDVFSSDRDQLVRNIFEVAMGVSTDNIYFTNLAKCYAGRGEKPSKNDISACYTYLMDEIGEVKPKAILCMGETALGFLCGDKGIARKHGEIYDLDCSEVGIAEPIKVVPTFLSGYITYNEHKLADFAKDIERAYNIAEGIIKNQDRTVQIVMCDTIEKVRQMADYVREAGIMCFDYESANNSPDKKHSALDWFRDSTYRTILSVSFQPSVSYVIPIDHFEATWTDEEYEEIEDIIQDLYEDYNIRKIGHNIKFDMHLGAKKRDINYRGRLDDTMLMHHLIDETTQHGLKELAGNYFKDYAGYEEEVRKHKWEEVPLSVLAPYGGTDTALTLLLAIHFENVLLEDERVYRIYRNLTMPALKVLYSMEHRGALIDRKALLVALAEAESMVERMDADIRTMPEVIRYEEYARREAVDKKLQQMIEKRDAATGRNRENWEVKIQDVRNGVTQVYDGVNFNSPPQMGKLLFTREGFNFPQLGKGTGKDVLEELNDDTGFVEKLLALRTINKLKGTYLQGILDRLDDNDRLHTTYKLQGTMSGRISSADPNLQNIPNVAKLKDPEIIKMVGTIKQLFIVEEGRTFFNWDLSQAELRMIAAFAQDRAMMTAYNEGQDLHKLTGAHLAQVSMDEFEAKPNDWQKEKRTRAKAANFGMIYGISAEGYMEYAKVTYGVVMTIKEAQRDIDTFFGLYNRLQEYHELYKAKARKFGYVRTLYGRKRRTPNILHNNGSLRSADERVAVNSPIQGSVGEWVLFVMVIASFRLPPEAFFVNNVHDSIMGSVPDEIRKEVSDMMVYTAENLPNQQYFGKDLEGIGMSMDAEYSKTNWKAMEEYKGD